MKADGARSPGCHSLEHGQHRSSVAGCNDLFRPERGFGVESGRRVGDNVASVDVAVSDYTGTPEHIWTPRDIVDAAVGSVDDRNCNYLELVVADDRIGSLMSVVRVPHCGTDGLGGYYCLSIAGHIAEHRGYRLRCWDIGFGVFGNRCCFRAVGEP